MTDGGQYDVDGEGVREWTAEAAHLREFAEELDRIVRQASADDVRYDVGASGATITLTYSWSESSGVRAGPELIPDGGVE